MFLACSRCHKQYDEKTQRSDCPHREFPKPCEIHGRKNCGNIECNQGTLVDISRNQQEKRYA